MPSLAPGWPSDASSGVDEVLAIGAGDGGLHGVAGAHGRRVAERLEGEVGLLLALLPAFVEVGGGELDPRDAVEPEIEPPHRLRDLGAGHARIEDAGGDHVAVGVEGGEDRELAALLLGFA